MRKETSNQFTEGLVSDLNPINTPNTVLTDNLNGTLITYNGNEFSLQNDQGNYELKNCRLPANYIPVGIKEYGDILYIVSYNPITEKVQIGSYPSPLTYESTKGLPCDKTIDSAIKKLIKDDEKSIKYSELLKELDGIIFNEERLKLNPGDQYKLLRTNEWDYHFENIDYKILNDESYYQDVTNLIKINQKKYEYVPWTTPGFLAINSVLADIKIHGLNIKYFYIDEDALKNKSFHFSFSIQLNVEDKHLKTEIENWIKEIDNPKKNNQTKDYQKIAFDFSLYEKYEKDGEAVEKELFREIDVDFFNNENWKDDKYNKYAVESGKYGYSEWYNDFIYLWKNIKGECKIEDFDRTIIVKITPIFYDKNDVRIEFDNLQQTLEFNLAEAEKGTYQLGDEIFQFKVDPETKEEIIAFNTKSPLVTDGAPQLKYRLYGFYTKEETEWIVLDNEFNWYNRREYHIDLDETVLGVEDAGYIEFQIETNAGPKNLGKRIIITSEYLNEFYDEAEWPVFDRDISLSDWLYKYFDESQIDYKLGKNEEYWDRSMYNGDIHKFYLKEFGSTFFTDDNELQTHYYWGGWCYLVEDVTIKSPEKIGNLWKETLENHFWYKNLQGDTTSDSYLYKVKQLECEFTRKAEPFEYIPDVKFVPLKPEIDNLNIIVNGTWITISYNNSKYYKELGADSDDYYWGKSNNLEGWIKSKGEYERVMWETKIGDTGIDDDLSTDTGGDKEDGENGGGNSESEDNNTGQTDTVLYWTEPDMFSVDVPCRLLKVQLKFSSPNKNKIWFGAIKEHPSIDYIPRDSTILPNWESEVTDSKTYYFLMLWGGEYHEVGFNRVAGSYVLVPFEEDISNVEDLYIDNFCPKLIQSKTDKDEPTPEICYCYNLLYNEGEKLANTITWAGVFNLGIEDISNDNTYKYRNILTPDNKVNDISGIIKYNFSKEFICTVDDDLSAFDFKDIITLIDEINEKSDENYNKWIENPLTDFGQISRDRWICLDKSLKNDSLKEELTRKLNRTYLNRHLVTYTYTNNSTLPDRIKLKPSTTSWACARMGRKDTTVNAGGKKNFVTIGTVWGNDDSTPNHYTINNSNWLS